MEDEGDSLVFQTAHNESVLREKVCHGNIHKNKNKDIRTQKEKDNE